MPNITTNHAINYTNLRDSEVFNTIAEYALLSRTVKNSYSEYRFAYLTPKLVQERMSLKRLVPSFESANQFLWCDNSKEISEIVLSLVNICFPALSK